MATKAGTTSIELEINYKPFSVGLEAPAMFRDFEDWKRGQFGRVTAIVNQLINPELHSPFAELGAELEYIKLALTNNRACAFAGGEVMSQPWTSRQPITERLWAEIMRDNGSDAVKLICQAYVALFPDAPR